MVSIAESLGDLENRPGVTASPPHSPTSSEMSQATASRLKAPINANTMAALVGGRVQSLREAPPSPTSTEMSQTSTQQTTQRSARKKKKTRKGSVPVVDI